MRINLPITNVERYLDADEFAVSKTDLQGKITYANQVFVRVSGFEENELFGQSHSIVRHPDMPEAAFMDLWRTLQSGRPWRGMIKNRCKNGDFYWGLVNANPTWEEGDIVGYVALHQCPSRDQVNNAEEIYRKFREGGIGGYGIEGGSVVRKWVWGGFLSRFI